MVHEYDEKLCNVICYLRTLLPQFQRSVLEPTCSLYYSRFQLYSIQSQPKCGQSRSSYTSPGEVPLSFESVFFSATLGFSACIYYGVKAFLLSRPSYKVTAIRGTPKSKRVLSFPSHSIYHLLSQKHRNFSSMETNRRGSLGEITVKESVKFFCFVPSFLRAVAA